jgi:hypothetical protein
VEQELFFLAECLSFLEPFAELLSFSGNFEYNCAENGAKTADYVQHGWMYFLTENFEN